MNAPEWWILLLQNPACLWVVGATNCASIALTWRFAVQRDKDRIDALKDDVERAEKANAQLRKEAEEGARRLLAGSSRPMTPTELSNGALKSRALELAAEIREAERAFVTATEQFPATRSQAMTEQEFENSREVARSRINAAEEFMRTGYRGIKPHAIAVRDALLSRVPPSVLRERPEMTDHLYQGQGVDRRLRHVAEDLERLAKALPE
jgi:hypothetical protein